MAIHTAELTAPASDAAALPQAETLAALPSGILVAIFDSREAAAGAALQLLTSDPGLLLWLRSGREAASAIRAARAGRGLLTRLLRGFGDEELAVREVLRQTESGRTTLVVKEPRVKLSPVLDDASHIYQFGLWSVRAIR